MSLYDRDYQQQAHTDTSIVNINAFVKQVYQLFSASILLAAVGAYIGIGMVETIASMYWILVIAEIGLLFGLYAVIRKPGINLLVMFAFTFISGLTLAPLLVHTMSMPAGGSIVANAFLLTSVAFGSLSLFAMNTKRDFSGMGKMLFVGVIVIIVASIINIFTQSPIFQLAISSIAAILFSAFILYDTQKVIRGDFATPIEGAIALYLDFLNLFVALLQILGLTRGDD